MTDIYTDGSCSGNPGPGGWGVLVVDGDRRREYYGGDIHTTNNRMELMATIRGLEETADAGMVRLFTDSLYVKNGIGNWIENWKRNGWKTASGKPVKNRDLWKMLDGQVSGRKIDWRWVRGHSGNPGNEHADRLARLGTEQSMDRSAAPESGGAE